MMIPQIPRFIQTTAVLSVLVLIGLHLPLQAEPPKIAPPRLDVRVSGNGLTASSSSASLMLQVAGPNDFQVTQHSKDGSLNWYNPGSLMDGHYRYDVYATPNIQRDDLTKAELGAIPTTRQSGRFRVEQGRLLVEPDPAAQRSQLSEPNTLWAALVDQLIPSAAAQNLTASGAEAHVIWDDTDSAGTFDWALRGDDNAGTGSDAFFLQDNTDGTFRQPFRIFAGVNNGDSFLVDSLGDIRLADSDVFIDRSTGNVNIGSTTETCCALFLTGRFFPEIGLKSTVSASTWKLGADEFAFFIRENLGFSSFVIENGAPRNSLRINNLGHVGLGTQIPQDKLHVLNDNLRIEQANATDNAQLNFIANGNTWEIKNNKDTGRLTFFAPGGGATTASFKFDRQAQENLFRVGVVGGDTVDINGNLVVTGTITPDYVFTPEYALESIEDHAAYMWQHQHLPAVQAGKVNAQGQGLINVGARSQGMLEELEKAHIYIEQLHEKATSRDTEIEALKSKVSTLKAKEARLETLENKMVALEGMMQQRVRNESAPSEG